MNRFFSSFMSHKKFFFLGGGGRRGLLPRDFFVWFPNHRKPKIFTGNLENKKVWLIHSVSFFPLGKWDTDHPLLYFKIIQDLILFSLPPGAVRGATIPSCWSKTSAPANSIGGDVFILKTNQHAFSPLKNVSPGHVLHALP